MGLVPTLIQYDLTLINDICKDLLSKYSEVLGGREYLVTLYSPGLPWWLSGKEYAGNAGDLSSIPGLGRSPGEGNATHSSILAWKIPWNEEPGGLQSLGLQRVRPD